VVPLVHAPPATVVRSQTGLVVDAVV